ncbi:uncharacterized protein N7484_003340, partial [Penicillium longicatenatum]|uniref:uncharacterized protein n=1 Tax=Penicillium longicatenatum TaxID=1561947 RepID=UPI0025482AFC
IPATALTTPDLGYKLYCKDDDFRAQGKLEPNNHSQTLIYTSANNDGLNQPSRVHFPLAMTSRGKKEDGERRNELLDFVRTIDFQSLLLLDDTVTELIYNANEDNKRMNLPNSTANRVILLDPPISKTLRFNTREDPDKFNKSSNSAFYTKAAKHHIFLRRSTTLPNKRGIQNNQQELKNFEQFKGVIKIVQLPGIAVSINPYAHTPPLKTFRFWL